MDNSIITRKSFQLSHKRKDDLIFIICMICMSLFLYTAYSKIVQYSVFAGGLSKVEFLAGYSGVVAWMVPVAEILVSLLLILPRTCRLGLFGFMILMIVFTIYIVAMLLFVKAVPCSCGAAIENLSWTQHIFFNLVFIFLSGIGLWLSKNK